MDKSGYRVFGILVCSVLILFSSIFVACSNNSLAPTDTHPSVENTTYKQEQISTNPSGPIQQREETWTPLSLRYDNLESQTDDYLYNQIAVWHTSCKYIFSIQTTPVLCGSSICDATVMPVLGGGQGDYGYTLKSPLIILPSKVGQGNVGMFVVKGGAGNYALACVGTTSYRDVDDVTSLGQPGWGLMTSFSPDKVPYKIQKINLCGVACHTSGSLDEYDKYHFVVRILDKDGRQLWREVYKWSFFHSGQTATDVSGALWKEIEVNGVTVSDDFSMEITAESNSLTVAGQQSVGHYLALAYERITDKDKINTRSFISENGKKAADYIRLYDQYGNPFGFNLCIRVEGSYLEK
jgi:hypothetical protein